MADKRVNKEAEDLAALVMQEGQNIDDILEGAAAGAAAGTTPGAGMISASVNVATVRLEDERQNSDRDGQFASAGQPANQPRTFRDHADWEQYLISKGEVIPVFGDPTGARSRAKDNGHLDYDYPSSRGTNYSQQQQQGQPRAAGVNEVQIDVTPTMGQPVYLRTIKPNRYNDDGKQSWEDFETQLTYQIYDKLPRQKVEILQASLGPEVLEWYHLQDDLWKKPYEEQIKQLRGNYSERGDGETPVDIPHDVVMKAGETISQYNIRAQRACIHLKPEPLQINPNESDHRQTARKIQYFGEKLNFERTQKNVFITGLPGPYRRKLFNRDELRAGPLQAIVRQCKRWEKTEQLVKRGDVNNSQLTSMAYHKSGAVSYPAQASGDANSDESSDEADEDEEVPTYSGTIESGFGNAKKSAKNALPQKADKEVRFTVESQAAQEKQKAKEKKNYLALVAKIEQLEELTKPEKLKERVDASLEGMLAGKVKSMMTKDTKPTAKAGTKGDPFTAKTEEQYRNREQFQNRRGGFSNRGRGGFSNRDGGRNGGGSNDNHNYNRDGYNNNRNGGYNNNYNGYNGNNGGGYNNNRNSGYGNNNNGYNGGSGNNRGNGNNSNFRGQRGGFAPRNRNEERQGQDNRQDRQNPKSSDQKQQSPDFKNWQVIAKAMEKNAEAIQQHTTALVQAGQSKN
jgi:hypothetical protein